MEITIRDTGLFGHIDVILDSDDSFTSEAGALFKMTSNTMLTTTTRKKGSGGGIFAAAKRLLASSSFFLTEYSSKNGEPVQLSLAPLMPGDCAKIDLEGSCRW